MLKPEVGWQRVVDVVVFFRRIADRVLFRCESAIHRRPPYAALLTIEAKRA
jgi:hypothetical protein